MKTTHLKFFSGLFSLALAWVAQAGTTIDPARDCPTIVQFELGDTAFKPGDSITIQELRGSTGLIQSGGTYCVTGTYTLASQDEASLSFFATTTNRNPTPVEPEQTIRVAKGTGSFSLAKHMTDDGYLHVSFYSRSSGQSFGGVYFGTGRWALHEEHSSHHGAAARSGASDSEPVSSAGANQVLFKFLGNPVPAPANMDAAYSKEGLTQAMKTAARNAGIVLAKLEIDDSEFPFLVGVTFAKPGDKPKFLEQIRKVPSYAASGGVGSETAYAMNIVPNQAFPPDTAERIYHRMMLRAAVLHENLVGGR